MCTNNRSKTSRRSREDNRLNTLKGIRMKLLNQISKASETWQARNRSILILTRHAGDAAIPKNSTIGFPTGSPRLQGRRSGRGAWLLVLGSVLLQFASFPAQAAVQFAGLWEPGNDANYVNVG